MKLRIIIPTIGRQQLLERTLRSLAECNMPAAYSGTIVVQNGSPPDVAIQRIIASYRESLDLEYIHVSRPNKSVALNAALEQLDDDCLAVFFDDDVRVAAQTIEAYAQTARAHSTAFFGGPVDVAQEVAPPTWARSGLPRSVVGWTPDKLEPRDVFLGANWAAYVRHIREAGGFDASFGPGNDAKAAGDETTLQIRMRAEGLSQVYVPDALVWHYVPKEKCSPWWAMKKAYRIGKTDGLTSQDLPDVRSIDVIFVRQLLRLAKYSCLRQPEGMFDATCKLVRDCGKARGTAERTLSRLVERRRAPLANDDASS